MSAFLVSMLAAASGCSGTDPEPKPVTPQPSRVEELMSLARVQDPASEETMEDALRTGTAAEREVAAFGLGQLGTAWEPVPDEVRKAAEDALVAALANEKEAAVRDRILEALGKVGREAGFAALTPLLDASAPPGERARAAIAVSFIARSTQNKLVSPEARDAMVAMLKDTDASVRYSGAYGLVRYRDPATKSALVACLSDGDPIVRSTCMKAFVTLGAPEDAPELAKHVGDTDDRVAAEAARTLTKLAVKCTTDDCSPLDALVAAKGPWRPAVMQAVAAEVWLDARAMPLFQARFDEYATSMSLDPKTRALMQCQAALGHDRAAGAITLIPQCGAGQVSDVQRDVLKARALVAKGGPELEALLQSDSFLVRGAAVPGAPASALPTLLADPDPIVTGGAAARAEELMATDVGPDLVKALGRLIGPASPPDAQEGVLSLLSAIGALDVKGGAQIVASLLDAEPYALRQAAAHALTKLTGETKIPRVPALLGPALEIGQTTVVVKTSRGDIRIRMLVEDAPRTAKNFVDLVGEKFYDGITIHRIVPNFVSQMGDPRGDGAGGPGHDIPCEINLHRYGAGTVGMALAGRDTGGSQLFIAHAPQPHLDGLYTTFGEVIEGLDVANGLSEGDTILEARVE
ncbi:peptidylprolyl isomerase [Polyangium aurulentum]|uniref:peptidylprolyl isomerase n=1 Tax=Polyangium aurulentum TaxID=2567896 RepID=UPI00146E4EBD|nr:peptidylprolyl isomerase [Polyangium aurulentum]UQA57285.1 peptidylprolyl isomerase [Polyangium aurulentum]